MTRQRVVQWSTGGVGAIAVRVLAERSDFELVGVWVHNPDKVGRDAGEIAGGSPIGVKASSDKAALLALRPDCVCYTASGESRPKEAVADICDMLSAGSNVVTTSIPGLVYPPAFDAKQVERLASAAHKGGASLYASGMEPGFAGDELVLRLATISHRIESVRTQEIFSYQDYPVPFTMFEVFGFGKAPGHRCIMQLPGIQLSSWGPPVRMVADHLGAQLDEIRETYEKRTTDRRIEIAAGVIEPGTVAAVRFETIGVVNGRDAIVIEHVNRVAPDVAPDWPTVATDAGTYRIIFKGEPQFTCDLTLGTPESFSAQGMLGTAMRVVNAIPYVCDAPPGLVTSADLPPLLPRGAFEKRRHG
jgi:2,4-diaminopentanoate dehydrogenase